MMVDHAQRRFGHSTFPEPQLSVLGHLHRRSDTPGKKRPMAFSFVTRLKRDNHHLQRQWGDRMTTVLRERGLARPIAYPTRACSSSRSTGEED
jgi:hypothetical protein